MLLLITAMLNTTTHNNRPIFEMQSSVVKCKPTVHHCSFEYLEYGLCNN